MPREIKFRVFDPTTKTIEEVGAIDWAFDIIAIPWAKTISTPKKLMSAIQKNIAIKFEHRSKKNHGRIAYTCAVGFGVCRLDFSFFPN